MTAIRWFPRAMDTSFAADTYVTLRAIGEFSPEIGLPLGDCAPLQVLSSADFTVLLFN
jgi:hypothetical protein